MDFLALLKKYWPTIVLVAGAVWGVLGTSIQSAVAAHPNLVAVLGPLVVALAHLLPSPVSKS
jgi:hypothetical protein